MSMKKAKSRVTAARVTGDANRALRQKANRAYVDARESDSEEEGRQAFSLEEKLSSKKFPECRQYFVKDMRGEEVDLAFFQKTGFNSPIHVANKSGLDILVPDSSFCVSDVRHYVGARRLVDVMDCTTQRNSVMTMKDFEEYYNNHDRRQQLNVISLEFSCTKLDPLVAAPKVVRQIDWTDNVWPRHLKEQQSEATNDIREMKYPKVQKYCLMSVKGCYTDFHIDFGGSSVWYHIVRGKKIFWIIPPTELNLKAYEAWTLSGHQGEIFFGDLVEKCGMVTLEAGSTFFIPSGWIHAVYTPEDSLVFGGNFLHSFAIEKQIRVAQIEEMTKVPQKFRFPFFTELQWYVLDKYVYALLGRTHLDLDDEEEEELLGTAEERRFYEDGASHRTLTPQELFGLKAIIMYIHALPVSKKNVPALIPEPINLVRDIRVLVNEHKNDTLEMAATGSPLLYWPGIHDQDGAPTVSSRRRRESKMSPSKDGSMKLKFKKQVRVPCRICQSCIRQDCGKCQHCADMVRYGGPGRLRKICVNRECVQPLLHTSLTCNICGLDGWYAEPHIKLVDRPPGTCALMECSTCFEVTHPTCATDYGVEGCIKMDLPNSWECPRCIKQGVAKGVETSDVTGPTPAKQIKTEPSTSAAASADGGPPMKIPIASGADTNFKGYQLFSVKGKSDTPKSELRTQLAEQILSASTQDLRQPPFIFRPPPMEITAENVYSRIKKEPGVLDLKMESVIMLKVFQMLSPADLSRCARVCKAWNSIVQDPSLWTTVKLPHWNITSHVLSLIVQRQPINLVLDWCNINRMQLNWLLPRIPQTRSLSMSGLDFLNCTVALSTCNAPMLDELNLAYTFGMNDAALYKLLSAPKDTRPGLLDKKSRLKNLTKLNVAGSEISDVSLRYITQYLSQLTTLDVSRCWKLTDAGLAQLASPEAKTCETLTSINLSGCPGITNQGLLQLTACLHLMEVYVVDSGVTQDGIRKFCDASRDKWRAQQGVIRRTMKIV